MKIIDKILEKSGYINKSVLQDPSFIRQMNSFGYNIQSSTKADFNTAFANLCFAMMITRAKPFAKANQVVMQGDEPTEQGHWLYDLLDGRPNPYMNWRQLKMLISYWLDFNGNAYLYFPHEGRYPNQVWIYPSNIMKPVKSNNKLIGHYELEVSGTRQRFETTEICHFKTLKPNNRDILSGIVLGKPLLLEASAIAVGADKELIEYIQSYFERDTVPPFVLKTPDKLSDPEWEQQKQRWNQIFTEYQIKGLLEGGAEVEQLQTSNQQSFATLGQIDESLILRLAPIWGVPPALLTTKYPNRNTASVIKNTFYEDTIDLLVSDFEDTLTDFFRQIEPDIYITHEPVSYVDTDAILEQKLKLYNNGIINRNELRTYLNMSEIEGGDEYLFGGSYMTFEQIKQTFSEPLPEKKNINKAWEGGTEEERKSYWKKWDALQSNEEENIKRDLVNGFNIIYKKLKKEISENKALDFYGVAKRDLRRPITFIDGNKWGDILTAETEPSIKKLIKKSITESLSDVGNPLNVSDFSNEIKDLLQDSLGKIRISGNTAAEEIGKQIKQIVNENPLASQTELMDKIKEKIDYKFNEVYTKSRVVTIAQTTSTFANGAAQSKSWDKAGFGMAWLSRRDSLVRDDHVAADGQEKKNGMFEVGGETMPHPGGGSDPGNNINCRCQQMPIKKG